MANDGSTAFDISNEMRKLAEKSVEQARMAFDSFVSATQHAVNTAQSQAISAQSGARDVADLAVRFAERNMSSSFQFAQKLLQAKDPQEVTQLHADYVNSQMAALADQARELSQKTANLARPSTH